MLATTLISLFIALACGIVLFARPAASRSPTLDVLFVLSVGVFLGAILTILVRRIAITLEADDAEPGESPDASSPDDVLRK